MQIAAIISTGFDVCGSFQALVWRPTHLSDADNYSEQITWQDSAVAKHGESALTFPVLSDDSAFGVHF